MQDVARVQTVEEDRVLYQDLVQVARAALDAQGHKAQPLIRQLARRYHRTRPELGAALISLLRESPARSVAALAPPVAPPTDNESRLPLLHVEDSVRPLPVEPVFSAEIGSAVRQMVLEHRQPHRLLEAGLTPTRTALFVGPPGVGKTLAARWVAQQLELPLVVLDLASVMSSLLGRTGENIRRVMAYAKQTPCVLLLDELDAVAKRRDDDSEVGELKRLVTVLLQEFDMWPEGSLLLAATNHENLLDPAVWRRFEVSLRFPLPDVAALAQALVAHLGGEQIDPSVVNLVAFAHIGTSFSDLERNVLRARRTAALDGQSINDALVAAIQNRIKSQPTATRVSLALELINSGLASQRRAHEVTGVSRDTLRKHLAKKESATEGIDEDA